MDAEVGATDDAEVNPEENGEGTRAPSNTRQGAMRKLLKRTLPVFDCGSCRCGSRRLTWTLSATRTLRHWPKRDANKTAEEALSKKNELSPRYEKAVDEDNRTIAKQRSEDQPAARRLRTRQRYAGMLRSANVHNAKQSGTVSPTERSVQAEAS
jgi:hypothetical protein